MVKYGDLYSEDVCRVSIIREKKQQKPKQMSADMCVSAKLREVSRILNVFIKKQIKRLTVAQFHESDPDFMNPYRQPTLQL